MSKQHRRLLERIASKPVPANVKWTELVSAMKSIGFTLLNRSGSRRQFFHEAQALVISCHEPHPSPDVDKGCLTDIANVLIENELIEGCRE